MEIRQRTATLDDADLLLNWRNERSVRELADYQAIRVKEFHILAGLKQI